MFIRVLFAVSLLPFCTSSSLRLRLPFPTSRTSYEEGSKRYNSLLAVMELHLSSSDLHHTSSDLRLDSVYTGNSSIAACVSTSSVWHLRPPTSPCSQYGRAALVSLTPAARKNGVFALVLPTEQVLEQLVLGSHFNFAPGLLDVLQSRTSPTISYFKSLPLHLVKLWAVYLLVLEKPGHRPKVYIGCGTESRSGVCTRIGQYNKGENLAMYVQRALDDGYTISHKGLLCWSPLPTAAERYRLRALYLVAEAAFSLYFWTMVSRKKDYGMPRLCPWSLDTLEYDGCCGYVSLTEKVQDTHENPTPEQIDVDDSERKLRNSGETHGQERTAHDQKNKRQKALASKKFSCNLCNVSFSANNQLENHKLAQKHINNASGIMKAVKNPTVKERMSRNLTARKYYCSSCDYAAKTQQKLDNHLKTPKHLMKVALAQSSS
jgi:hypothetical protein